MKEVHPGLFVGDDSDCRASETSAVVHACKHQCHQNAVGYSGSLDQSHPEYLVADRGSDRYLNIVDMDRKLSHEYTEPIVVAALDFIEENLDSTDVLVHCNQGRSRSPAIAMLYLAKREDEIPNSDYESAKQAFSERYPRFRPNSGIDAYLRDYWHRL